MASESNLETYLVNQCKAHRIFIRKLQAVGRVGFPDRSLIYGGRVIFVELKPPTGKGRLSKMQEREIKKLRDVGAEVRIIWTRKGVEDVIEEITRT